jgi:Flp pilus assembly protein TadD
MDTESLEFHADYSPLLRALTPFTFGVLLPLAVFGIAITASDVRRLAVMYGIVLVFLVSVVLFFVLARYRYPVVPVLALFAGAALANLRGAWRERRGQLMAGAVATTEETPGNFGRELLRMDRAREAVPLLQRAVTLLPEDASMRRDLALAYLKSGDAAAALREYRQVIDREPNDAEHHRELAAAAEAAGDPALALASLRAAARLEPSNPAASIRLGDFLMRAGQVSEARATYERALAASGVDPIDAVRVQVRIASLDLAAGQMAKALTALQDASARAHASGQTAVAADVDATIDAVRARVTRAK